MKPLEDHSSLLQLWPSRGQFLGCGEEGRARAGVANSHDAEEGCSPHLLDLGGINKYLSEVADRLDSHFTVSLS